MTLSARCAKPNLKRRPRMSVVALFGISPRPPPDEPLTEAERKLAPSAHPAWRSTSGLRTPEGLHVTVKSTRLGTLTTPRRVLEDYRAGKLGVGQYYLVP